MSYPSFTKTFHKRSYPAIDPQRPELSAKGKTVIVTGGGDGSIGGEAALSFAKAGATKIAVVGRTEKTLDQTKEKIEAAHPEVRVIVIVADVSKAESIGMASHNIRVELGAWDVFVNGAAYLPATTTMIGADEDDWWKAFEINAKFCHLFAKHFLSKCRPNATYISLNAASAHIPATYLPGHSAYAASKTAAIKLDEFLALENPSLRVFTIHPGIVNTRLYKKVAGEQRVVPTGANNTDDIALPANFCVWLASNQAEFLRSRYLWVNWDVEEMLARQSEIEADSSLLRLQIGGWPFS